MRFAFGVILLFAMSFGGVFWYQNQQDPAAPITVSVLLSSVPEEYKRVQQSFRDIGADEAEEFDRALVAYHDHRNKNALRQDVGGLVYRVLDNNQDALNRAGLPWLERVTGETIDLIRRYQTYGEAFCSLSIQRDHSRAERQLGRNRRQQETIELIEEFRQARFKLAILMLEALVDGMNSPVTVPDVNRDNPQDILIATASAEDAEIIRRLKTPDWTCREAIAVLKTALAIENDGERHAALAVMRTSI